MKLPELIDRTVTVGLKTVKKLMTGSKQWLVLPAVWPLIVNLMLT